MQRAKRPQNNVVSNDHGNKKRKLLTENKSQFEELANEILYEIFEYLDFYHIYQGFFDLNKRFQNLLLHDTLRIRINISTISKSNVERYHQDIVLPNKHRIDSLHLSNPFTVDMIFSPPRILVKFLRLEKLVLDQFHTKYLNNLLKQLIHLPALHSLVLAPIERISNVNLLFFHILRLSKLKYCKLTYQTKTDAEQLLIPFNTYDCSPIEYLIINTRFQFESFNGLLSCFPKLRYLSIDCLVDMPMRNIPFDPLVLKHLKSVSLNLNKVYFERLELIIRNFFRRIRVFRLTTNFDLAYLNAKKWQKLIESSMPKLRIFDFYHENNVQMIQRDYHDLIDQFTSSFWIERQWFFTHRHYRKSFSHWATFYSTNPYRRKDYTFNWRLDRPISFDLQVRNLTSVKHVTICDSPGQINSVNYFPNATELTLNDDFEIDDGASTIFLNRIIPLKQLKKLVINCYDLSFEQFLELLRSTPNLHTLQFDFISFSIINEQTTKFRDAANTNQIRNIHITDCSTVFDIHFIAGLFPRLEHLQIGIHRNDIVRITRCLLSQTNRKKTPNLTFVGLLGLPKVCLRELNMLIERERLLDHCSIKYLNRNLYLWW